MSVSWVRDEWAGFLTSRIHAADPTTPVNGITGLERIKEVQEMHHYLDSRPVPDVTPPAAGAWYAEFYDAEGNLLKTVNWAGGPPPGPVPEGAAFWRALFSHSVGEHEMRFGHVGEP